jgi:hypothetical protein
MTFAVPISVARILTNISEALILGDCKHSPDALLGGSLDDDPLSVVYTSPTNMFYEWSKGEKPEKPVISCVAVDGDNGLRMVALGSHIVPTVIRGRTCLSCTIEVCRLSTFPALIL